MKVGAAGVDRSTVTETVVVKEVSGPVSDTESRTTRTATFRNTVFETQTEIIEYTVKYVWNEDGTVTAAATNKADPNSIIKETAEVTGEVTKEPTEEAEGTKTLTATFENDLFKAQTKEETIPKRPFSAW